MATEFSVLTTYYRADLSDFERGAAKVDARLAEQDRKAGNAVARLNQTLERGRREFVSSQIAASEKAAGGIVSSYVKAAQASQKAIDGLRLAAPGVNTRDVDSAILRSQSAILKLQGAVENLSRPTQTAGQSVQSFGSHAATAARSSNLLAGAVGGLVALTGFQLANTVRSAASAWLDYSAKVENTRISLATMMGGASAAENQLKQLEAFARRTPFNFSELIDANARMLALGFSSKEVIPVLEDVGNAVAAAGGGNERLQLVVKALADIRAKGKVEAQEMRQLAESGIPAWRLLGEHIGKSQAEVRKLSEAGEISSDVFFEAFRKFSQANFGGLMEAQSRTFRGALSNIQDALLATSSRAFAPLYESISQISVRFAEELTGAQGIPGVVRASENALVGAGGTIAGYVVGGIAESIGSKLSSSGVLDVIAAYFERFEINKNIGQRFLEGLAPNYFKDVGLKDVAAPNIPRAGIVAPVRVSEGEANRTKEQIKLGEKLSDLYKDLAGQLYFYGLKSQEAAAKQRLLRDGVVDLNSGLAAQIVATAQAIDAQARLAEETERASKRIDDAYQRQITAGEDLTATARRALHESVELQASVRTGLSEVEKFELSIVQRAEKAGLGLDEFNAKFAGQLTFVRDELNKLDAAKLENVVNKQLAALEEKLFEVRNATGDGLSGLKQYELFLLKLGDNARKLSEDQLTKLREAFVGVADAEGFKRKVEEVERAALRLSENISQQFRKAGESQTEDLLRGVADIEGLKATREELERVVSILNQPAAEVGPLGRRGELQEAFLDILKSAQRVPGAVQLSGDALIALSIRFAEAAEGAKKLDDQLREQKALESYSRLAGELSLVIEGEVTGTHALRVEKLLLGQAYQYLTDQQRESLRSMAAEADAAVVLRKADRERIEQMDDVAQDLAGLFGDAFDNIGGKWSDLWRDMAQTARRIASRIVEESLYQIFAGALGVPQDRRQGAGGLVGLLTGGLSGLFNRQPALPTGTLQPGFGLAGLLPVPNLQGFASGGSFRVGGYGGTDSSLVAFRATPGEHVTVTPPGHGGMPNINLNVAISPRQIRELQEVESSGVGAKLSRTIRAKRDRRRNVLRFA